MDKGEDAREAYRALGVKPIIVASGMVTMYGGTKTRPEVMEVMSKAASVMVDLHELNRQAGKVIAELTGAEAGMVTSGAAGGLVLQAAACIAGSDPAAMARLPDTQGLKNEIVIQNCHRFAYDQTYRVAGARLVGAGDGRSCQPWALEAAINDRTAAVAYLFSAFISRRALPLAQVSQIAHDRGVPVIVDAASYLPPRANLRRFIREGADMVIYSGGKAVRGPQGAGILCGRADLIEAALANGSPNQFIGRGMKVAKEEIVGLVTALRIFVDEDEDAETRRYLRMCRSVVDALYEVPGITATVQHDGHSYLVPTAVIKFQVDWDGISRDQVLSAMAEGEPSIRLHYLGNPDEVAVEPTNLDDAELETVISRLREVLAG